MRAHSIRNSNKNSTVMKLDVKKFLQGRPRPPALAKMLTRDLIAVTNLVNTKIWRQFYEFC